MFNIISYREFLMRIAETTNEAHKHSTSEPVSNNVDTEKIFSKVHRRKRYFRHKPIYIWRQWTLQAGRPQLIATPFASCFFHSANTTHKSKHFFPPFEASNCAEVCWTFSLIFSVVLMCRISAFVTVCVEFRKLALIEFFSGGVSMACHVGFGVMKYSCSRRSCQCS